MSLAENSQLPPPPPLPPSFLTQLKPQNLTHIISEPKEDELDLAVKQLLSVEGNLSKIFYKSYVCLKPQLQEGPKCGLVALSIASSIFNDFTNVDDIYKKAVSEGFTKQGEMFSAEHLAFLAENCCGFNTRVITGGLNVHLQCIIQNLMNKNLLLVPYDADYNHSPCCKKGFKAHWAVISGFVIFKSAEENNDDEDNVVAVDSQNVLCECIKNNLNLDLGDALTFFASKEKLLLFKTFINNSSSKKIGEGKIYLIGRQGKSRHLGLWSFDEMSKSNNNLLYFSCNRDYESYVLPEGGPEMGLKGKAIILSKNK